MSTTKILIEFDTGNSEFNTDEDIRQGVLHSLNLFLTGGGSKIMDGNGNSVGEIKDISNNEGIIDFLHDNK